MDPTLVLNRVQKTCLCQQLLTDMYLILLTRGKGGCWNQILRKSAPAMALARISATHQISASYTSCTLASEYD